jgi:hypothetical protein
VRRTGQSRHVDHPDPVLLASLERKNGIVVGSRPGGQLGVGMDVGVVVHDVDEGGFWKPGKGGV